MYQANEEKQPKTNLQPAVTALTIVALICAVLHSAGFFFTEKTVYSGDLTKTSVTLQWSFLDPSVNIVWQVIGFICYLTPYILLALAVLRFSRRRAAWALLAAAFVAIVLVYLNGALYYALLLWKNALWHNQVDSAFVRAAVVMLVRDSLMVLTGFGGIIAVVNAYSPKMWAIVPPALGLAETAYCAVEFFGTVGGISEGNYYFTLICNFTFILASAAFFTAVLLYGLKERDSVVLTFAFTEPVGQNKADVLKELQEKVRQGVITPEEYDKRWKRLQKK